jgi:hypothetical protein
MSYYIPALIILYTIITITYELNKSHKTKKKKKPTSPKRTRSYIKEKIALENKHCHELSNFDSRGIFSGVSGSVADKTGKFSSTYHDEMEELNKKYGLSPDE